MGGKLGGALQIVRDVVFWWLGEIPAVGTDVVTLASVTLEGRRVYLFPIPRSVPGETLGPVRAAASSSSLSFLEVLLGMRRFRALGLWWDFAGEDVAVESHFRFR